MTRVAVVILNYNGKKFLQQFLPSVIRFSSESEIIVADNGSTDGSISFLEKYYPQVKLIRFDQNNGFAKGYNMALQDIRADYYALINSDIDVQPVWLTPIIDLLEQDELNAACQPKLISYNNKKIFEYTCITKILINMARFR